MLRFFWIIVAGLGWINGANAQIDEPLPWTVIQKNLRKMKSSDAQHYLDSIWQQNGTNYSADVRIQFILKKGKYIEKIEGREAGAQFLFSDSIRQSVLNGNASPRRLGSYYRARAGLARHLDNYAEAIADYDLALAHYQGSTKSQKSTVECFYFAGQCAIRMLNYEKAINYYRQVLNSKNPGKRKTNSQRFLLMALNFTNQPAEVVEIFQGIENFQDLSPLAQIRMQKEYGIAVAKLGDKTQAEKEVRSILKKGRAGEANEPGLHTYAQFQAGEIFAEAKIFDKAIDLYLKSIATDQRIAVGEKDRELAKKYERLGTIYLTAGKYRLALAASQEALIQIFPQFNNKDITANPEVTAIRRESFMMSIPALKARCLRALYLENKDLNLLRNASVCHGLSLQAVQLLLAGYQSETSKLFLQSYISDYLEEALATEYTLATLANDEQALSRAFAFMSTQKAIVLREALVKNAALITAEIPYAIQEADKQGLEKIQDLRFSLAQAKNQSAQDSIQQLLNNQISSYQAASLLMQKRYPAYAGLLTQPASLSLSAVQQKLKANQALLQFFWGTDNVYAFRIEKNNLKLNALLTNQLAEPLSDFISRINDRKLLENEPGEFFKLSHQLANDLFTNTAVEKNQTPINITIIPDGPLFFLPFGCLTNSAKETSYKKADYLLNKYIFTYAYSPDLYFAESIARASNGKALGIFPFLKNEKPGFAPLASGSEEINALDNSVDLVTGKQASLAQFKQAAGPYSLIHLSTHANTGNTQQPPSIEFIDSTLYLPQVYSSKISADLVVLSACETSRGDLQAGEGAMSLARGFFYAGANNLIATLWSVNEKSTSQLLADFYAQAFDNGLSLSAALTTAQRNYLQDEQVSPLKKSPYYWAGLHLNGKDGKLQLTRKSYWPWMVFAIVLFGSGWFFYKKSGARG